MKQKVIGNDQIFYTIREELLKAKNEIVVVSSWFTDKELIEILGKKQKEGISVKVAISDNTENSEIDYAPFVNEGGELYKIKINKGGMMHQKFCIIDSKTAIHGSYNWTNNARKRNNESVILTTHTETINSLYKTFQGIVNTIDLQNKSSRFSLKKFFKIKKHKLNGENNGTEKNGQQNHQPTELEELETLLNEMIESEIFKFDKNQLTEEGFNRSKLTNGDHQTLPNTLDTLYADFVNSLDLAEEKKKSLTLKINETKSNKINKLNLERDREINIKETELHTKRNIIDQEISSNNTKVDLHKLDIEKITSYEIDKPETENQNHINDIEKLEVEFIHSKIRWFELIPVILLGLILLGYLIVFYSSAAYILVFSELDAKLAQMNSKPVPPIEVFDPMAIHNAIEKGGTALLFIALFVIIPIVLAVIRKFLPATIKKIGQVIIWIAIFIIDTVLAYVVAKSVHEVDYLSGKVNERWKFEDFYTSENFYLVFILGALGLILFKFIYEKFHSTFEERNKDLVRAKNHKIIANLRKKIIKNEGKIKVGIIKVTDIRKLVVELENSASEKLKEENLLPILFEKEKEFIIKNVDIRINEIDNLVSLYLNRIENNDLKFSTSALIDRINTFLDGWINYLHDNYSVHRATEMSNNATLTKNQWMDLKIKKHATTFN